MLYCASGIIQSLIKKIMMIGTIFFNFLKA